MTHTRTLEKTVMQNCMIDLETLGTHPGAVILSIGAVEFDVHAGLGRTFYVEISQYSSKGAGFETDQDTLDWWQRQEPEARGLLDRTSRGGELPHRALRQFNDWLPADPLVWGNGAAFDNALLTEAFRRCGIRPHYEYHSDRCYRTLKALFPRIELVRTGTFHHALDDARSQAKHAVRLLRQVTEDQSVDLLELAHRADDVSGAAPLPCELGSY